MNLYERDYTTLTFEEETTWRTLKKNEVVDSIGELPIVCSLYRQYPKAARHFESIFPNHYLDIVELANREHLSTQLLEFPALLETTIVNERAILNFINRKHAYFLVASILKKYYGRFGHHDAYLFPEFQIGNSYKADYLLVGLGSGGWEFVFLELEAPNGSITLNGGDLGNSFRKGLKQIEDWDTWLDGNYSSLKETFNKHKKKETILPEEFTTLDKSRLHFVVVAGRRKNFDENTNRIRRKKINEGVLILHYDNLVDSARDIIGQATY
jgi:hypothetical protein